jgi:hypothetical protein
MPPLTGEHENAVMLILTLSDRYKAGTLCHAETAATPTLPN